MNRTNGYVSNGLSSNEHTELDGKMEDIHDNGRGSPRTHSNGNGFAALPQVIDGVSVPEIKAPPTHVQVAPRPRRRRGRQPVPGRVTISDIARQAGVSKTAVSFAFNMPGRLSKETTEHILEVARQMGYTPNPIARSLNTRRTNAIGLIVPQDIPDVMQNPFFAELMRGVGEVCREAGLSLMLIPPMRGSLVDATYAALVDGCIVTGMDPDDPVVKALVQRRIPFVMIDTDAPESIASVNIDDADGARLALGHLLDRGHRSIALLSFESNSGSISEYRGTLRRRFDGFGQALVAHGLGLTSPGISVLETACSVDGGRLALDQLLLISPRPTAVVALSDAIAWGVMAAAAEHGLRVPEDLAVVGFDDLPASGLVHPPLTSVRQPAVAKGRRAAELFVELVRCDGNCQPKHEVLPVELIVRASS
jgi:DNA-binding LacI/PurR family transcriptional regulator